MRSNAARRQRRRQPYRRTVWCDSGAFRETRHLLVMSQDQVADLLRVSVRTVRNWERGTRRVPYSSYKLLQTR